MGLTFEKLENGNVTITGYDSGLKKSYDSGKSIIQQGDKIKLLYDFGETAESFTVEQVDNVIRDDGTNVPISDIDTLFNELTTYFFFSLDSGGGGGGISSVTGIDPIEDSGITNKQIKLKDGTLPNQVFEWDGSQWSLIPTPGGSSSVSVGPTMQGDGTPSNPLDLSNIFQTLIVDTTSRSITNQQNINTNTNDIQNLQTNKLSEVIHDSSLTGAGTSASPLSVAGENTYSESITQAQWIDQGDGTFLYQMNHGLNTRNIVFSVRDTNTNKFVFLTEYEASTNLFLELTNTERVDVTVSIIAADNNFLLI